MSIKNGKVEQVNIKDSDISQIFGVCSDMLFIMGNTLIYNNYLITNKLPDCEVLKSAYNGNINELVEQMEGMQGNLEDFRKKLVVYGAKIANFEGVPYDVNKEEYKPFNPEVLIKVQEELFGISPKTPKEQADNFYLRALRVNNQDALSYSKQIFSYMEKHWLDEAREELFNEVKPIIKTFTNLEKASFSALNKDGRGAR